MIRHKLNLPTGSTNNSNRQYKMRRWCAVAVLAIVFTFYRRTSRLLIRTSFDSASSKDKHINSAILKDAIITLDFDTTNDATSSDTTTTKPSTELSEKIIRRNVAPEGWSEVKLAIYMATHLPPAHIAFLPCWNDAIQRLNIFEYADLIIFTASDLAPEHLALLPFRSVTIKTYKNPGYQEGAVQAMVEPFLEDTTWFDEYDWVIRLNPDVLIREDKWLMKTMLNVSVDGIFHDCHNGAFLPDGPFLHTDFFAFRPDKINRDKLLAADRSQAEAHTTIIFRQIFDAGRVALVEGAFNSMQGQCRIEGDKSPVLHVHELSNFCPYYYDAKRKGVYR